MKSSNVDSRLEEFWSNVWDHAADEFQRKFDNALPLQKPEVDLMEELCRLALRTAKEGLSDSEFDLRLREVLRKNPEVVDRLVQWLGLTRNKVLQDLKASARALGIAARTSSLDGAISHQETWPLVASYLRPRIVGLAVAIGESPTFESAMRAVNLVTWPGYIRQERAKRMGHEAERRAAEILHALGIPFAPESKLTNPLQRDIQINGSSFDLVVPDAKSPRIVVKSTVHTANIGQYGESKDHLEMTDARKALSAIPDAQRPLLVACIDGVGFSSNKAGLVGVLSTADQFFQFKTIWKFVAMAASATGVALDIALPEASLKAHADFIATFRSRSVRFIGQQGIPASWTVAGEAMIGARG